jgi:prepilin-type N-terminal cleavage/methylation domain-containing protein
MGGCRCSVDRRPQSGAQSGLTLIELVMVLTVVAILSATLLMRGPPAAGRSTAAYQAQQLAEDLRHARMLALAGGRSLQFRIMATGYRVCLASVDCSVVSLALQEPGHPGGRFEVALGHDLAFPQSLTLQFDTLGRPQIATALNLELQLSGISLVRVTVTPLTGSVAVDVLQ